MPNLRIIRSAEFSNRIRSFRLYLDGTKIGDIANGEIKDFEITPGRHRLIAKIDWTTSNEIEFEVAEQDVVFNVCGTNPALALYYITFGWRNYLKLTMV
jgi:hypothetical protein